MSEKLRFCSFITESTSRRPSSRSFVARGMLKVDKQTSAYSRIAINSNFLASILDKSSLLSTSEYFYVIK